MASLPPVDDPADEHQHVDEPPLREVQPPSKVTIFVWKLAGVVAVLGFLWLVNGGWQSMQRKRHAARQRLEQRQDIEARMRLVATALPRYASEHEGRLPQTWQQLVPAYLSPQELEHVLHSSYGGPPVMHPASPQFRGAGAERIMASLNVYEGVVEGGVRRPSFYVVYGDGRVVEQAFPLGQIREQAGLPREIPQG